MGVRSWIAAGLLAAGLCAPATAEAGIINVTIESYQAAYKGTKQIYPDLTYIDTYLLNYHLILNYQLNTDTGAIIEYGYDKPDTSFTIGQGGHELIINDNYMADVDGFTVSFARIVSYPEVFEDGGSYYFNIDGKKTGVSAVASVYSYYNGSYFDTHTITASIPEAPTWGLMLAGLIALAIQQKRRGEKSRPCFNQATTPSVLRNA